MTKPIARDPIYRGRVFDVGSQAQAIAGLRPL
jgi:hypothetical protein